MAIYKYMSEKRIESILIDNQIRFTQPKYFNDPFDVNPSFEKTNFKKELQRLNDKELEELFNFLISHNNNYDKSFNSEEKRNNFRQGLLELSEDEVRNNIQKVFSEEVNQEVGILSLTKDFDNILMWAHYAHDYQGFVIEFDENDNLFKDAMKVEYDTERPNELLTRLNLNSVFLRKSIFWEKETEYRIIKPLKELFVPDNKKEDIYVSKFPKQAIKSVYCGDRMSQKDINDILNYRNADNELSHVNIYKLEISNTRYAFQKPILLK